MSRTESEKERAFEQKIAAVEELFKKREWDERVPKILKDWGRGEGYYRIDVGIYPYFPDITLALGGTYISTQGDWRVLNAHKTEGEIELELRGRPVGEVRAIQEGDGRFDGEEKIEFTLPEEGLVVRINRSGGVKISSE